MELSVRAANNLEEGTVIPLTFSLCEPNIGIVFLQGDQFITIGPK